MRIDFYLLQSEDAEQRWLFACQLIEKAWLRGHRVFVYCSNQKDAEGIDELLWNFRSDSFVPHHIQGEGPEPPPPVQIGFGAEPRGFSDIMVNLSGKIPDFSQRFQRIIEIVINNEAQKEKSRNHYREYRRRQYEIHTHNIG
tara:strand:+ start:638 stop:1063 length:426 start_codon:yes stop_codon:yes gene_type:complete